MIDNEIRELLDKLSSRTRRNYANELRKLNIHVGQDHALCQLWQEDGITQVQLSIRMGCEAPTITNMVKKLENYGLVYRQRDELDARVSRVYLTPEGKNLRQPVQEVWRRQQDKLLEGVLPEERLMLRRLLKQMSDNIS